MLSRCREGVGAAGEAEGPLAWPAEEEPLLAPRKPQCTGGVPSALGLTGCGPCAHRPGSAHRSADCRRCVTSGTWGSRVPSPWPAALPAPT